VNLLVGVDFVSGARKATVVPVSDSAMVSAGSGARA